MLTAMRVREDVGRVSALIYGYLVQLYVQLYRSATTEPAVSVKEVIYSMLEAV